MAVSSVSNSDGTLTISPTTGNVIASLNLSHANTWSAKQTFSATGIAIKGAGTGVGTFAYANSSTSGTITFPAVTDTVAVLGSAQTFTATQTITPSTAGNALVVNTTDLVVNTSTHAVTTRNNTLDNGSGNATINKLLTVGSGISLSGSQPQLVINQSGGGGFFEYLQVFSANGTSSITFQSFLGSELNGLLTLPNVTDTVAVLGTAQTFTAVQTISGIINIGLVASNVGTISSTYAVGSSDDVLIANATSGAFTITLPSANAQTGREVTIIKSDSSTNVITVITSGSDTIEGASSKTLSSQYNKALLVSDGSSVWYDLGSGLV